MYEYTRSILAKYITPSPSIYPPQSFNPVTPSDFLSGHSSTSLSFYTCPLYFFLLYSPSIHSIDWFASSLSALKNNPEQPQSSSDLNPLQILSNIPYAKCVTKSSNATPFASASISSTRSTHALLMDSAVMKYRKRLSWLVIPVKSTQQAVYLLSCLVRGGGLILAIGVGT